MASLGVRSVARSLRRSFVARSSPPSFSLPAPPPTRRLAPSFSFSRMPVELAALAGSSLFPLHSAVAAARLTSRLSEASRSCRGLSQGILCCTYPGL